MIPVDIITSPRFEGALTWLRQAAGADAGLWPQLASVLAPPPHEPDLDAILLSAQQSLAGHTSAGHPVGIFITEAFAPFWQHCSGLYAEAAGRIAEMLAAHPRADLGTLFGFDVAIDRQHLGLRRRIGAVRRIAPARLVSIRLYPSAFNPDHLWHLGELADGYYLVHLPVHDAALAAQCRPFFAAPDKAPVAITPASALVASVRARTNGPAPLAAIFRALGDASRFTMVEMLAQATAAAGTLTGAEISRRLGLSTPAVTHHLNELRRAGLIDEQRQGTAIHLTLRRSVFEELSAQSLRDLFGKGPASPPQRSRRKKVPN